MNIKTTTLTPAAIIDKYRGYLSNYGSIKSEREAVWFASSMKSMNSTVERCLFLQILHSTCINNGDKHIINSLLTSGGWSVLSSWLSEYFQVKNKPVLCEMVRLLDDVPVTISLLKTGNTGRLIKSITKIDDDDLRSLSKNLMKKWMSFISENTNKVKKEPVTGDIDKNTNSFTSKDIVANVCSTECKEVAKIKNNMEQSIATSLSQCNEFYDQEVENSTAPRDEYSFASSESWHQHMNDFAHSKEGDYQKKFSVDTFESNFSLDTFQNSPVNLQNNQANLPHGRASDFRNSSLNIQNNQSNIPHSRAGDIQNSPVNLQNDQTNIPHSRAGDFHNSPVSTQNNQTKLPRSKAGDFQNNPVNLQNDQTNLPQNTVNSFQNTRENFQTNLPQDTLQNFQNTTVNFQNNQTNLPQDTLQNFQNTTVNFQSNQTNIPQSTLQNFQNTTVNFQSNQTNLPQDTVQNFQNTTVNFQNNQTNLPQNTMDSFQNTSVNFRNNQANLPQSTLQNFQNSMISGCTPHISLNFVPLNTLNDSENDQSDTSNSSLSQMQRFPNYETDPSNSPLSQMQRFPNYETDPSNSPLSQMQRFPNYETDPSNSPLSQTQRFPNYETDPSNSPLSQMQRFPNYETNPSNSPLSQMQRFPNYQPDSQIPPQSQINNYGNYQTSLQIPSLNQLQNLPNYQPDSSNSPLNQMQRFSNYQPDSFNSPHSQIKINDNYQSSSQIPPLNQLQNLPYYQLDSLNSPLSQIKINDSYQTNPQIPPLNQIQHLPNYKLDSSNSSHSQIQNLPNYQPDSPIPPLNQMQPSNVEASSLNVGCYTDIREEDLHRFVKSDSDCEEIEKDSCFLVNDGQFIQEKIKNLKLKGNSLVNNDNLDKLVQIPETLYNLSVEHKLDNTYNYERTVESQTCLKRPKSTVKRKLTWKNESELVSVRYFTKDPDEEVVAAPSNCGGSNNEFDSRSKKSKANYLSYWKPLMKIKMEETEVRSQYGKLSHFKPLQDLTEQNKYIYDDDDEELIVPDEDDVHFDTTTAASLIYARRKINRPVNNDYPADEGGAYNRFYEHGTEGGHFFNSRANVERAGFLPVSEDTSSYDPQRKLRNLPLHELDDLRKNEKYRNLTFQPINQHPLRYSQNYANEAPRPSLLGRAPIRTRPVNQQNKPMKVVPCRMFVKDGFCRFGDNCHFIHNEQKKNE